MTTSRRIKATAMGMLAISGLMLLAFAYSSSTERGMLVQVASASGRPAREGSIVRFSVYVTNMTCRAVHVSVIPACQCTSIKIQEYTLKPWQRMLIPAVVHTKAMLPGYKKRSLMLMYETGTDSWTGNADFKFLLLPPIRENGVQGG
jgi:hypothetical protein